MMDSKLCTGDGFKLSADNDQHSVLKLDWHVELVIYLHLVLSIERWHKYGGCGFEQTESLA